MPTYAIVVVKPKGEPETLTTVHGPDAEARAHKYARSIAVPDRGEIAVVELRNHATLFVGLDGKTSTNPTDVGLPAGDMEVRAK